MITSVYIWTYLVWWLVLPRFQVEQGLSKLSDIYFVKKLCTLECHLASYVNFSTKPETFCFSSMVWNALPAMVSLQWKNGWWFALNLWGQCVEEKPPLLEFNGRSGNLLYDVLMMQTAQIFSQLSLPWYENQAFIHVHQSEEPTFVLCG